MQRIPILLIPLLFLLVRLQAQKAAPLSIGETHTFRSEILRENRTVNIYLPKEYDPAADKHYPVIYLLDGAMDEDFVHIAGLTQFLTMIDTLPPSILVGIANVDRKRDFTFPSAIRELTQKYPTTGGAANFIAFLSQELQPFVKKHYKVNDTSTLIGQSLGGLLATAILLKQPDMFLNYVIISPSLWWDEGALMTMAPFLISQRNIRAHVFIAVGDEGAEMQDAASNLATVLQDARQKELYTNFLYMPKETHRTILHNSVYKALQVLHVKRKP
ncbi:alpha/beta hydrolase [Chitinophaga pinensis]|uniref:Alpha/beta hydrolase n=1 Tax=Chitinophaga pinensis TaxID=79329 RepID=A0A5C6LR61_9BACT|nr:alpha/beta hydrolase-fold protein [Chitinophaga pinensis]TWV99810.1 alpha/beta hydrolase [Chitinophaga pinensis]